MFALYKTLLNELDLKIFVEASEKTRLRRRIKRDVKERGRTKKSVIQQWKETAEPMYKKYIEPQKKGADFIIINE